MTNSFFQDIIIPSFAGLIFLIILGAFIALAYRTIRAFRKNELRPDETLGLPRGTIRSFFVITFTAIMFLVFFGDFGAVEIPLEDRKWFLAAYASILTFYFGSKIIPERSASLGLVISGISPPVSNPPSGNDPADEAIEINGNGFESPRSVAFVQDGVELPVSAMTSDSQRRISAVITLAADAPLGAYDIIVELANGSRIVKTSGYSLEKTRAANGGQ